VAPHEVITLVINTWNDLTAYHPD